MAYFKGFNNKFDPPPQIVAPDNKMSSLLAENFPYYKHSVMQLDRNSCCGAVVMDSVRMA